MLRGLGYEPYQTGNFTEGGKYYWVRVERAGWTCNVRFRLSPSTQIVWLQTYLGEVPPTGQVLPEALAY